MIISQYPARLSSKIMLSTNTVQLGFTLEGEEKFEFTAGQFIQLIFEKDGETFKRSYSIANAPADFAQTGELEIALSFVDNGVASELFKSEDVGFKLKIAGPFGALTLPKDIPGQLILAGTGTGLAPYRSMIPELKKLVGDGTRVTVLMGFRQRDEGIYIDDFKQLANVDYRICLTQEESVKDHENEFEGRVQMQFDDLNLNSDSDIIYLCGNPGMIDDSVSLLRNEGFSPRQIKREKYNFSGH
ncbi:FAD-binding oxidoreductase [Endozoicomonas ascidiicola]|uniref:FAD-binding oxidoreductase n=1 Tax=Endozoicomonas ascidiicola TaxID=1698521 RepID=UPI00082DFC4B|nr:FAD-binding oxidoreductase [Endozoicomonas ascidiicola]